MSKTESQPTPGRKSQIDARRRWCRALGAVGVLGFVAVGVQAGADIIDPQAEAPKLDYIAGSSGPHLPITAVDPRIPAAVADRIAEAEVVVDTNSDGAEPGTYVGHTCGGTYVDGGIETAAHCFAPKLAARGSAALPRDILTTEFNAVTLTPLSRNGAEATMLRRSQTLFKTNLPQGNDLVGVTPGEPDSIEIKKRDGQLKLPLRPVAPSVNALGMGEEVLLYPVAVDEQIYDGRVTGTYTGINGVPAVVAHFEPLNGKNPLRAGASGSGVFVMESGEVRLAAVVSGTFYLADGTGVDAILSQDDVRRISNETYAPQYGPHRLNTMPSVSPPGELGVAKGFVPKNTMPASSRTTLFQTSRAHEPAVDPRRRKR